MLKSTAELECDCDHKTNFDYAIPGTLAAVEKRVKCEGCGSIFYFRFVKIPSGTVRFTMSLSAPSRKLANIIAQKKIRAGENAPQKKAPQFFLTRARRH